MNERLTPLKAIRANCLECCCGWSAYEVKLCPIKTCPLYPYRLGKNPYLPKRELTEEQRKAAAERFARNMEKSRLKNREKNHESFGREFIPPESQTQDSLTVATGKNPKQGKSEGVPNGEGV